MADGREKVQSILQDYAETLEVLTINSKPLINDLTMAADRYKPLAAEIVAVIESRLFEVPVNQKLPLLYLLDSILKNLRGPYLEVINTKVVAIFCHCFEKLTEPKIRISLYKLRQTWNPFIVKKKLAAIDKHVHALDPNWPVTATVTAPTSPTIHVNPDFLPVGEKGGKKVLSTTASTSLSTTTTATVSRPQTTSTTTSLTTLLSVYQSTNDTTVKDPQVSTAAMAGPQSLAQRRKDVLEAQKRKKEELMGKRGGGGVSGAIPTVNNNTAGPAPSPASRNASLTDPRKASLVSVGVSPAKKETKSEKGTKKKVVKEGKKGKRKTPASIPRRPLSSRSSLSPDYDSKTSDRKKVKVSSRPRSASPTTPTCSKPHPFKKSKVTEERGEKKAGGIGDILKGLDIQRLMGSIQKVKEQTEGDRSTSEADEPPPEKKPKLDEDVVNSGTSSSEKGEIGKVKEVDEEDIIPAIKSSHLDLDDIPMELLPKHQEKIMKQVEKQLKSGKLSEEQHMTLVKQLDQLYALQRKKENGRGGRVKREREHSPSPPQSHKDSHHQPSPSPPPPSPPSPPPSSHSQTHRSGHPLSSNSIVTDPPSPLPPPQSVPHHPSSSSSSSSSNTHSDSDFHRPTLSPPPPSSRSEPQIDPRVPHTHSRQPPPPPPSQSRDRYSRRSPPYPPRGSRPYRGGRGRRPYNRPHPPPPPHPAEARPAIDWHGQGLPEEEGSGCHDKPPLDSQTSNFGQNQGNVTSDPGELFYKLVQSGLIGGGRGGGGTQEGGVAHDDRQPPSGRGAPPHPPPPHHHHHHQQQQMIPHQQIPPSQTGPPHPPPHPLPPPPHRPPFNIPRLTFTTATLKKPYTTLVHLMHMGDPCATCGLRFRDRTATEYSRHLDWHYKINSRDKTEQKPRNWFLHPEDWIKFEESMNDEEKRELLVLEKEVEAMEEGGGGEGDTVQDESQENSCQVLPGEESELCTICAEQFEQFWEEEEEEWHFREAVRIEGKLYHVYCYQDAKQSGLLDRSLQQASPAGTEHKPLAVA